MANTDWYFFEDDVLNSATYLRWQNLTLFELNDERDIIMKKLDGAWGYNETVRTRLIKLLDKFDKYYDHRLELYRQETKEFQNGKTTKD